VPGLILTAYFDESGTHEASADLTLAGAIGTPTQWRHYVEEMRRIQRRDGFMVFHAVDLKGRKGEFATWPDDKRARLIDDMAKAGGKLHHGVSVGLDKAKYREEYRRTPSPSKMNLDSAYGPCFRGCLNAFISRAFMFKGETRLNVVLESGHPNTGNAKGIFEETRRALLDSGIELLGTITCEAKSSCPHLASADFLAFMRNMQNAKDRKGEKAFNPPPGPGERHTLTHLFFQPNSLADIKRQFEEIRQGRMERWRAERSKRRVT
jgi:hypothetical protein